VASPSKSSGKISKSKKRRMRRLKRKGKPAVVIDGTTEADCEIQPDTEAGQPPRYSSCSEDNIPVHHSSPPHDSESGDKNLAAHQVDEPDISLCHQSPEHVISESQLSPSDIDPPVFYYETNILLVFVLSMAMAHFVGRL
jgi:hypothetical protein